MSGHAWGKVVIGWLGKTELMNLAGAERIITRGRRWRPPTPDVLAISCITILQPAASKGTLA